MNFYKYTLLVLLTAFGTATAFGQCSVPSSNPNKFVVIDTGKQVTEESENKKYLSGGVTLQINGYTLKADSAVIFTATKQFEAYGNVVLVKNNKKFISSSTAIYREDLHMLNFMHNVESYQENQPAIAKSSAVYDVSQ